MTDQVGTAYVKLRPDFAGFKSQTQLGVKESLIGIAKVAGVAFGAREGFEFGKGLVEDAARVQKSAETIRAEFGSAGKSVVEFADTTGIKLGIASHVSEDAAARFGILFKNIGVGKDQAAAMTVNLEKLAGSIAAIRGKDPGEVLGTLPLALSGSLRGLRQLGFAFTPVQVKEEALRLGLIKTKQQALDPGARALAIYGLVTQNLGVYQQQAAKHANDAYNIQKRLSAEWDHAKETLGLELLPQISKYGGELSDFIDKAVKSGEVQHDFNRIVADSKTVIGDVAGAVKTTKDAFQEFSDIVGGDHNAIKILADAFLLLYTRSKLIKWGLITAGEKEVGDAATISAGKVGALDGALGKLKKLGPIAALIALDFVPKAKPTGDPNAFSNSRFAKDFTKIPFVGNLFSQANKLSDAINSKLGITVSPTVKSSFKGGPTAFDKGGALNSLTILKGAAASADAGRKGAKSVTDAIAAGVGEGGPQLKRSVTDALREPVDAAREALAGVKQQLAADIASMPQAIADAVNQAKQNLNSIGSQLESDIGSFLDKKGQAPPSLGPVLTGRLKQLQDLIKKGTATGPQAQQLAKELQNQIAARANLPQPDASAAKDRIARKISDTSDLFNKGDIGIKGFDARIDQILKSAGVKAAVIARTQGVAAGDQFRADIQGLKAQAAAIAASPKRSGAGLEATIVRPIDTLREQERRIADDQKQVARASQSLQRTQVDETKKQTALLTKMEAKLPSKHDTAELEKLLREQRTNATANAARRRAHGRHGG